MPDERTPILIVGGGLSGLSCALRLHEEGKEFLLLESSDAVGGRVRTDAVDGFLLDRGFQVLLEAYPEAQRVLDYQALQLRSFFPGCFVRSANGMQLMADPWREPLRAAQSLFSSPATWGDRFRIAALRGEAGKHDTPPAHRPVDDIPTRAYLEQRGFSTEFIHRFFRPFFRGIFLEPELSTSARMFHFVFGMMARGNTSVPANGMEEIPRQMAARLPGESIRCNAACTRIEGLQAVCANGKSIACDHLVLATDQFTTSRLLGLPVPEPPRRTTCLYFAAEQSPVALPAIVLNGDGTGSLNHVAVMSDIAPAYAPQGASLIAATIVGEPADDDASLARRVRRELQSWFGQPAEEWRHLRTYRIPFAQPNQDAGVFSRPRLPASLPAGVTLCGDSVTDASIDGALRSGRQAAEMLLS